MSPGPLETASKASAAGRGLAQTPSRLRGTHPAATVTSGYRCVREKALLFRPPSVWAAAPAALVIPATPATFLSKPY